MYGKGRMVVFRDPCSEAQDISVEIDKVGALPTCSQKRDSPDPHGPPHGPSAIALNRAPRGKEKDREYTNAAHTFIHTHTIHTHTHYTQTYTQAHVDKKTMVLLRYPKPPAK